MFPFGLSLEGPVAYRVVPQTVGFSVRVRLHV